ncbi:MAG: PH domain-containing protein [Spirochaetes bacterium]|nr:PH domain-containing protein [Spirochaetota bacterium]
MRSIDNLLNKDEQIISKAKQHWAILLGPLIVLLIGWLMLDSKTTQAYIVLAFGIIWGAISCISLHKSIILLTDSRLIISIGFPAVKSFYIPLSDIKVFDFYQPSLGSILNFGKILFILNDGSKKVFRFINAPAELVREVHTQAVRFAEKKNTINKKNSLSSR